MVEVNDAITNPQVDVEPIYKAQNAAFGPTDYPFLLEILRRTRARRVLDIGTGEGSFVIGLAQQMPDVSYDAIDLNGKLINIAAARAAALALPIQFRHDCFDHSYADSGYDLVIARFAVEHIRELEDIDALISATLRTLRPGGWLAVIEYYVHDLDISDPIWMQFRRRELRTYLAASVHPRIGLRLPESLVVAGYQNIRSTLNYISPSTIGPDEFYDLVRAYTKLYSGVAPRCWPSTVLREVMDWCALRNPQGEPHLLTSHTVGQRI